MLNKLYRYPVSAGGNPGLSTAQLAARTGMSAGTLRMWESRHGFPAPARLPGGHRRYSERDADAVLEVLRLRDQGLSLAAAIDRARHHETREAAPSVFAGLRQRHPELAASILPKRALLALAHAIEDEYCARAAQGVLIASFQRERHYRASQRRWTELARTATAVVVLADFRALAEPPGGPIEVPVGVRHPLAREWTLIIEAPGTRACLSAWEQPGDTGRRDGERRFEVMWSFAPGVVRSAGELARELLWSLAPQVARRLPALEPAAVLDGSELPFADALAHRMIGYLSGLLDQGGPAG